MGKKNFFEGWYFKIGCPDYTAAFIPSYHIDRKGNKKVCVQFADNSGSDIFEFAGGSIQIKRHPFEVKIDNNRFGADKLSFQSDRLNAEFSFSNQIQPKYDIMGFFKYFPFMQCKHRVLFFGGDARGFIEYNGQKRILDNALAYLESDLGTSFPKKYLWTHCHNKNFTVMLSIADIPYLGLNFSGCICLIYYEGKEYRLATYNGAKVTEVSCDNAKIKKGGYVFLARRLESSPKSLKAPLLGQMTRTIKEHTHVKTRYRLEYKNTVIFDFEEYGGFEFFEE